jgi:hypothetical protein
MGLFSFTLNIILLSILAFISYVTFASFNRREDPSVTAFQVYKSLLGKDQSISLSKPSFGDIGIFTGYDWPNDKKSGIGGGFIVENPFDLSDRPDIQYVSTTGTT